MFGVAAEVGLLEDLGVWGVVSTTGWPRLLKTVDVSGGLVRALKLTASAVDFANGALKSKRTVKAEVVHEEDKFHDI